MKNDNLSRRGFLKKTGLVTTGGLLTPFLPTVIYKDRFGSKINNSISVSTDFVSGGGSVSIINFDPVTLKISPHNQRDGGWSQVWWHFLIEGIIPGTEVTLLLERGDPEIEGISPQANFSYNQQDWGLTNSGKFESFDLESFFVYRHSVRNNKVWFAYDLPYNPEHMDSLLIPHAEADPYIDVFELCKTMKGRSVKTIRFNASESSGKKYGIWLQARAHAFESGSSWVLHELTKWLFSENEDARALRKIADITVIPIVDVDAVVEGRTGKLQAPHDHNRGWDQNPANWPQIHVTQTAIKELAGQNMLDLFIDFHGPGNERHPYFIIPESEGLPSENQRLNRSKFFDHLNAKSLDEEASKTQSMTQIHYSARPWERISKGNSMSWVIYNSNENTIALTLEVNMNTPLSTKSGYRSEALALGEAMSKYFVGNYHQK